MKINKNLLFFSVFYSLLLFSIISSSTITENSTNNNKGLKISEKITKANLDTTQPVKIAYYNIL